MTVEQAIDAGRKALAANRALTQDEFQGIRDAMNSPSVDEVTRGTLRGLGAALERQSNERLQLQQQRATEAMIKERVQRVAARRERWRALSPIVRAAHLSGDQRLLAFARLCEQDTAEMRPADSFEPADSPRALGLGEPG